jgi:hypothetical protein
MASAFEPFPMSAAKARYTNGDRPRGVDCPLTRPRSARFVATVDVFSQTPIHQRRDEYWLSSNRRRSHWFLWLGYESDMWDGWEYLVYAFVPRRGLDARQAAILLLQCGWRGERDAGFLTEPPESVIGEGLLRAAEVKAIMRSVWPD